jgi:hypothetical protein
MKENIFVETHNCASRMTSRFQKRLSYRKLQAGDAIMRLYIQNYCF